MASLCMASNRALPLGELASSAGPCTGALQTASTPAWWSASRARTSDIICRMSSRRSSCTRREGCPTAVPRSTSPACPEQQPSRPRSGTSSTSSTSAATAPPIKSTRRTKVEPPLGGVWSSSRRSVVVCPPAEVVEWGEVLVAAGGVGEVMVAAGEVLVAAVVSPLGVTGEVGIAGGVVVVTTGGVAFGVVVTIGGTGSAVVVTTGGIAFGVVVTTGGIGGAVGITTGGVEVEVEGAAVGEKVGCGVGTAAGSGVTTTSDKIPCELWYAANAANTPPRARNASSKQRTL
mmetsp:Transcript_53386/g.139135  ORF Transcript_53386/g.139135 Transcript_53386/m.139135 type:complete len:289 (-) Transcript_53386:71-937(-)